MGKQVNLAKFDDVVINVVKAKKILDVGGAWEPYNHATHILDLEAFPRSGQVVNAKWIQGDACRPRTWDVFDDKEFDFVVCTHTLEDVYDPFTILEQMSRVGKSGYIEVPSAFAETMKFMSPEEFQPVINGYIHHHWIFMLSEPQNDSEDYYLVGTQKRPELIIPDLTDMKGPEINGWRRLSFFGLFWYDSIEGEYVPNDIPKQLEYFKEMRKVWEDPRYMSFYQPVTFQNRFARRYYGEKKEN